MKQELNNYDRIARYYDRLSRLVFFQAQVRAQKDQLHFIPPGSKILIVGGGTGWILEELSTIYPEGLYITFIEISASMIELAKKRGTGRNEVHFIHKAVEQYESAENFDVVMTAFLFDNFAKERAATVFSKLDRLLNDRGLWLFADFTLTQGGGKWWKKGLLKLMYFYFKRIAKVESSTLVNVDHLFSKLEVVVEKHYYHDFIRSTVYRK